MNRTVAAAVILLFIACGAFENRVIVSNETTETVSSVTISVCDLDWRIETLEPGEKVTFKAVYTTDGHFHVSSPELSGDFGYVTHGLTGDQAVITFREDRIDFRQTSGGY